MLLTFADETWLSKKTVTGFAGRMVFNVKGFSLSIIRRRETNETLGTFLFSLLAPHKV